jgi:hypothetical protein
MDTATRLAIQAIIRGLHQSAAITDATVTEIIGQLHGAAIDRHDALDPISAREITSLPTR